MAKMSEVLEKALEEILGTTNLPTRYPDFQALTRDLVRKLADKLVLVDRKTWNEVNRSPDTAVSGLIEVTERFKKHNDNLEAAMSKRESIPPVIYHDCMAKSGTRYCLLPEHSPTMPHKWSDPFEDSAPNVPNAPTYHAGRSNNARR